MQRKKEAVVEPPNKKLELLTPSSSVGVAKFPDWPSSMLGIQSEELKTEIDIQDKHDLAYQGTNKYEPKLRVAKGKTKKRNKKDDESIDNTSTPVDWA